MYIYEIAIHQMIKFNRTANIMNIMVTKTARQHVCYLVLTQL